MKPKRKSSENSDYTAKQVQAKAMPIIYKFGEAVPVEKISETLSAYYRSIHRTGWRILNRLNINDLFSIANENKEFSLTFLRSGDRLKIIGKPEQPDGKTAGYRLFSDHSTEETRKLDELIKS